MSPESLESGVERPLVRWAQQDGWEVRKLQYVARVGAPDRMFYKDGRVVFIEFKSLKGKLSKMQEREGQRMLNAGLEYYVVRTLVEGAHYLGLKKRAAATHSAAPTE